MNRSLTPKQARFVHEYLVDLNGAQAAVRAGYSPKTSRSIASENLTKPNIRAAVVAGKTKQLEAADLSAARTLEEARRIGFSNIGEFFDADGHLRPIHELTAEQSAQLSTVTKKGRKGMGGADETVYTIRLWDKLRALELLAKHFGLLNQRGTVSTSNDDEILRRLARGRTRTAGRVSTECIRS